MIWDTDIEQVIVSAIRDREVASGQRATLLHDVFTHNPQLAFRLAEELFEAESGASGRHEHAVAIAAAMFRDATGAGWQLLWPKFKSDGSFGMSVLEQAAHGQDSLPGLKTLSEHQLAELYVWMVKQLPYSDKETGAHFVTYRDSAEMLRDGLLHALKSRQTFEAVEALSWIQEQLPEAVWMRFHVRQGEELARTGTWEPPVPNTVLSALLDHEKRVIQSAADLRNAVIESLQRLQQELTAETPAIDDLWDESTKGKFRPKNEAHLSNYVKRHLSRELPTTILGREVQIESSYGARAESTDIHVDAVARPASGKEQRVSVIVETKGCWNRNLWSDINDQLFRRYLQHGTNQGIYLVGWYNCESWDPLDYRRARAPNMSSSAAWEKLRRLASVLPKHHKHVEAFVLNCALPLPHPGKQ